MDLDHIWRSACLLGTLTATRRGSSTILRLGRSLFRKGQTLTSDSFLGLAILMLTHSLPLLLLHLCSVFGMQMWIRCRFWGGKWMLLLLLVTWKMLPSIRIILWQTQHLLHLLPLLFLLLWLLLLFQPHLLLSEHALGIDLLLLTQVHLLLDALLARVAHLENGGRLGRRLETMMLILTPLRMPLMLLEMPLEMQRWNPSLRTHFWLKSSVPCSPLVRKRLSLRRIVKR